MSRHVQHVATQHAPFYRIELSPMFRRLDGFQVAPRQPETAWETFLRTGSFFRSSHLLLGLFGFEWQEGFETALRWLQDGSQIAPRWLDDSPRWPQDGLGTAQDDSMIAYDDSKLALDRPRQPKAASEIHSISCKIRGDISNMHRVVRFREE
jgi:hypothetical protein